MKTDVSVAILYWSTKIGGVATIIPSIAARLRQRHATSVSVFLKRRDGIITRAAERARFHYFSKNTYSGAKIAFMSWLLHNLFIAKPDYILVFLNRFTLVAVLYKLSAALLGRKTVIVIDQAAVLDSYLYQYESWYWKPMMRACFTFVDRIIVNSRAIEKDLNHNFSVSSAKIRLVRSWVVPAKRARTMKKRYDCIFVGRLSPEKGIETLLDTAVYCQTKIPGFSLAIIGDGALKGWMIEDIRKRGLAPNISYLGYQINPRKFMRQASLLLLPSYNEGLPMVILEAYSVGIPVAVTPFLGAGEAVENGKTGIITGRDEYPAAVCRLLGDTKKLADMGRAAHIKAKNDFGMQNLDRFVETIFATRRAS
ncbi:MAG: glycosyltransferase [Candidatus Gottesmanbacteria bacterium]|nr:glycosyltransferase [Candidatus Gottesmanbacteria bacterium]